MTICGSQGGSMAKHISLWAIAIAVVADDLIANWTAQILRIVGVDPGTPRGPYGRRQLLPFAVLFAPE